MPELLSIFRRKPAAAVATTQPSAKSVSIEWRGDDGTVTRYEARMQVSGRLPVAVTVETPPEGRLARVLEDDSSYPVEVLGVNACEGGYEIQLDYLWQGRRRQQRIAVDGSAQLVPNGCEGIAVEVLNASPAGMKLYSTQPVDEGTPARIVGTRDSYICFVRYCSTVLQGYHIGIQFYSDGH